MTLRLDMQFVDGDKYISEVLIDFKKHIFDVANQIWVDGVKVFVRKAVDVVLIDTAMSAISLTAPLDVIQGELPLDIQSEILGNRNRLRAQPLLTVDGRVVKDVYREAFSAYQEAKRNSIITELSFKNDLLEFNYTVSAWQITHVMDDRPVDVGFKEFESFVAKEFGRMESKLKLNTFLNPFKMTKVKFTAKAR